MGLALTVWWCDAWEIDPPPNSLIKAFALSCRSSHSGEEAGDSHPGFNHVDHRLKIRYDFNTALGI